MEHILLRHRDIPDIHKLDIYRQHDGYKALEKALNSEPQEIIDVVRNSNLRGRVFPPA